IAHYCVVWSRYRLWQQIIVPAFECEREFLESLDGPGLDPIYLHFGKGCRIMLIWFGLSLTPGHAQPQLCLGSSNRSREKNVTNCQRNFREELFRISLTRNQHLTIGSR